MTQEFAFIGKRVPKLDAIDKVTGRAIYGHDMKLPRMLYGKILRSERAHARILNMDTSRAKKLAGVKAVITGYDIPDIRVGFARDHPVLKTGKVRSFRDEIAAVAAVDEDTAQEALELIKVEYEDLPAVFDPEEAIKPGASLVHEEAERNILSLMTQSYSHGEVEKGFAESDVVIEDRFTLTRVAHCCMGTSFCLASFDHAGNLTVWSSTQMPFMSQRELSTALKMPPEKIRVIKATIGGGFGSKLDTYPFEPICVLLAQKTGRPVRITFTREEEFIASPTRQPVICDIKSGAKKDGTLMARQVKMILDNGAYSSWGATTPLVMMQTISSLYRVPNVQYDVLVVYTNNPYAGAMRGYGNPQATFVVESHTDMLAHELGMDPVEFRLKNANQPGDVTGQGIKITSCGLRECIEKVAESISKGAREQITPSPLHPSTSAPLHRRGVGMACQLHVGGGARIYPSDGCGTTIKVDDYGKVTVITGSSDMGQGSDTVIAQIVAEEMGVPVDNITVVNTDTDITPWDVGAHASRTTFIAGNSARLAAGDAKRQILEAAAQAYKQEVENLDMREGQIFVKGEPEEGIPYAKAIRAGHFRPDGDIILARSWYEPPTEKQDKEFRGNISAAYAFAAQAAEVEVDIETGEVKVLKIAAAHDVGRAINPMAVEGQIEGGVSMGLGYGLSEELVLEEGRLLNPNFADYALPTALDMPPIDPIIVESIDPQGPFGAKGMAEPANNPTAPAIANAIYDAVGVRIKDLPITAEKVLQGIRESGNQGSGNRVSRPPDHSFPDYSFPSRTCIDVLRLNPCICAAELYVAGTSIEEIQRRYGLEEIIKQASNENALGPSPLAVKAMQETLTDIHRYPPVADDELRAKLASTLSDGGLSEECFITGNGSCDVLAMVTRAFVYEAGDEAILCPPTFQLFEMVVNVCGGQSIFVNLKEDFTYDLPRVLDSITDRTRLVFLCNPNNPTGTVLDRDELHDFLTQVPSCVLVVIDEAYRDYVDPELLPDTLAYIREGRNVLSVRSFSKVYGLAGLRIGYGIAYEELAQYIRRLRLPFHLNALSMRGAIAALDDREHVERSVQHNRVEREFLYAGLDELELSYARSQSNFILVRPGCDPQLIYERMLEKGVIVRPMAAFRAHDCLRITVGTRAENERLLQALGEAVSVIRESAARESGKLANQGSGSHLMPDSLVPDH